MILINDSQRYIYFYIYTPVSFIFWYVRNPLPLFKYRKIYLTKLTILGFQDIFQKSESVWCTQHMESNDFEMIKRYYTNKNDQQRIMADIYGTQNNVILQDGLADAIDEEDFDIKIDSIRYIWEELSPGFHEWFVKNRSQMFKDCLILSSREKLGITKRFSTKALEAKHRLQKKVLREDKTPKKVVAVLETLKDWVDGYYKEVRRALRGIGKYRLAIEFEHFYVPPARWVSWSDKRRNQHFDKFMQADTHVFAFEKPKSNAGNKPGSGKEKRRVNQPEPEVFIDRLEPVSKVAKTTDTDNEVIVLNLAR